MQAGSLYDSFPARSASSGWDRPTGKKRGLAGRGAAWRPGRDATPAQNGGPRLDALNDFFIRTSDEEHKRFVQGLLQRLYDNWHVCEGGYRDSPSSPRGSRA